MKPKPADARFRNLYAYRGSIWYERVHAGKRYRVDLEAQSWHTAADRRDAYEVLHEIPLVRTATRSVAMPTLRDFVKRYLESDVAHLAETTRSDRASYLREKGPLVVHLGDARLDEIDAPALREWWAKVVDTPYKDASGHVRKRGTSTGRHYLNVLAAVLDYARDLELIESTPIAAFREQLRRRSRTKSGRVASDAGRHIRPIDDPGALRSCWPKPGRKARSARNAP